MRASQSLVKSCARISFNILLYSGSIPSVSTLSDRLAYSHEQPTIIDFAGWFQSTISSRWVTLRPAVVSTARIWSGVSRLLDIPRASGGRCPRFFGGVRFIARRLRRPFLGECQRGRCIWGIVGASRLRPCARTHLKKGLLPHLSGWWDSRQIPLISISWIKLMWHTSTGRGINGTDLVGYVSSLDIPRASRVRPSRL